MLGSDYPFDMGVEAPVALIDQATYRRTIEQNILSGLRRLSWGLKAHSHDAADPGQEQILPQLNFEKLIPILAEGFKDFHSGRAKVASITNIDVPEARARCISSPATWRAATISASRSNCYYDNPAKGFQPGTASWCWPIVAMGRSKLYCATPGSLPRCEQREPAPSPSTSLRNPRQRHLAWSAPDTSLLACSRDHACAADRADFCLGPQSRQGERPRGTPCARNKSFGAGRDP